MTMNIELAPDVERYFEHVVHAAARARKVRASEACERYLAALLSGYARGEQEPGAMDRPLTFMLHDALRATGGCRFRMLRSIGDGVLYVLGFFSEALTHRGADRAYVMTVGSTAYGHAAMMLKMGGTEAAGSDVLGELAHSFRDFVDVLTEVSDGAAANDTGDPGSVLRLYERWRRTGSQRLAQQLGALGLCPSPPGKGLQ